MFLAKLKAALVTVAVLGFVGVGIVYSGGGGSPQPKNELESLRRENELLKVNLRVTLEKIEALEKQVAGLKGDTTKQRHAARELDAYRLYAEQMGAARLEQAAKQQALAEAERARTDDLALRLTRKQAIAVADAERARADAIAARADADLALRLTHKKLQEMDAIMILVSKLRASQENKEGRQQALDALDGLLKKLRDGEQKGKAAEPAKKNPGSQ